MNLERERELFERWCVKDDEFCIHRYAGSDDYSDDYTQCAWLAWLASASRDGYKLVPVDFLKRCDDHLYTAQCYEGNSNDNLNQIIDDSISLKAMLGAVE